MVSDCDGDEPVGYGKPPRSHRFKPGTSGNPLGRPKLSKTPIDDFREAEAARLVTVRGQNGKVNQMTKAEVAAHALVNAALGGDISAIADVLRLEKKLSKAGLLIRAIQLNLTLVG